MDIEINKNKLRKISLKFRMYASGLLRTTPDDGMRNLKKFLNFISENTLINSFIQKNYKEFDIPSICSYNSLRVGQSVPDESPKDEISFTYQALQYGLGKFYNYDDGYWQLALCIQGFTRGKQKDAVDKFNHNIVQPFINYIENYLTELQIDLGEDENAKVTIHIHGDNYGNNTGATMSETNINQSKSSIGVGFNQGEVKADKIAGIINEKEIMMSQESKKSSTFNLQNAQIAGGIVNADTVHGQHFGGNINNYAPEQKQNLVEAAVEIQQLLEQLEQTYPTNTQQEKQTVVAEAIERINNNPSLKARVVRALKAGSIEAFKELIDHPLVNIFLAGLEGWREAE